MAFTTLALEEDDSPHAVVFELEARDAESAEKTATLLARRGAKIVGLRIRKPEVAWVAPLDRSGLESSARFLRQAEDLFDEERFDLSVVAAQIHLEVQIGTLLEKCADREGSGVHGKVLSRFGYKNPTSSLGLAAIKLILDHDLTQSHSWPRLSAHVKRRNDIVHDAQPVRKKDAAESLRVVRDVWIELLQAAQDSGHFRRPESLETTTDQLESWPFEQQSLLQFEESQGESRQL